VPLEKRTRKLRVFVTRRHASLRLLAPRAGSSRRSSPSAVAALVLSSLLLQGTCCQRQQVAPLCLAVACQQMRPQDQAARLVDQLPPRCPPLVQAPHQRSQQRSSLVALLLLATSPRRMGSSQMAQAPSTRPQARQHPGEHPHPLEVFRQLQLHQMVRHLMTLRVVLPLTRSSPLEKPR
jgi:hypothetical protein